MSAWVNHSLVLEQPKRNSFFLTVFGVSYSLDKRKSVHVLESVPSPKAYLILLFPVAQPIGIGTGRPEYPYQRALLVGVCVAAEQKCTLTTDSCDNDKAFTLRNNVIPLF